MKSTAWQSLVAASLLIAALSSAETRPQYGGALRISTRTAPASLDPATPSFSDSITGRNLIHLIFDTLVTVDDMGNIHPTLATSWQAEAGDQRWQFWLRRDVKFHDGSPLTSDVTAASLRAVNPTWNVSPSGDSVIIELDAPTPNLPAQLALPGNAIARRSPGGRILGTGAFQIADWQPEKKLTLSANEGYWNGRPFIDSIAIEMGKGLREQMVALELGKTDVIELATDQARRAGIGAGRVVASAPTELMALVFAGDRQSPEDGKLRQALSLSIDRAAIRNVLLQRNGDPAGGILPNWISGYEFVFPTIGNLRHAQELRGEVPRAPAWTLGYEVSDPLAKLIAERIALNARDAGITVQPSASGATDLRLLRVPVVSADARMILTRFAANLGLSQPKFNSNSTEDLYQAESKMLQSQRLIPLFHLPAAYALGPAVKAWGQDRYGTWCLADVWVSAEKP